MIDVFVILYSSLSLAGYFCLYNIEYQLYAETAFFIKIWREVYIISFADIIVSMIRSKTIIGREKEKDLL